MQTLQDLLSERLASGDTRLHLGAVEKNRAGDIRIVFAAIGAAKKIVLAIAGDEVTIVDPAPAIEASADASIPLPINPADHSKDALLDMASTMGVPVDRANTKAAIADTINEHAGFAAE